MKPLKPSAQRVQAALTELELPLEVIELPKSTRSAAEAATAIDCTLGQIAKSLIFKTKISKRPILVIASGINRVDEELVRAIVGEEICQANAEFVRQHTGFAIGGVPPIGHLTPITTIIDADILIFDEIWAAAGTPNAVFRLTGSDLVRITGGQVAAIKRKAA